MAHKIVWKDGESNELIADLAFQNESQFRLFYFDREGKPQVIGKLSLQVMRKPLTEPSERWAADHALEFRNVLEGQIHECRPEMLSTLPANVNC